MFLDSHFLVCLLVSGACSFIQNLCAFAMIHQLTTLSYSISNVTKRIIVILLSLIMLGNHFTPLNLFGMMLSILGVFIYNRVIIIKISALDVFECAFIILNIPKVTLK